MAERIKTYTEFYRFYLSEYQNKTSRILLFIGTFLVSVLLFFAILKGWGWEWVFLPLVGYGFAWVGHAFLEKKKSATFQFPFWSLITNFKLFSRSCSGTKVSIPGKINR